MAKRSAINPACGGTVYFPPPLPSNCRNCGAPVSILGCEYCGTGEGFFTSGSLAVSWDNNRDIVQDLLDLKDRLDPKSEVTPVIIQV